jgi:dTDP-L-rhamnose 4-epimerase
VGLGLRASDVTSYVADNDTGTAAGLWAMDAVGFQGRLVLASSMVVYGEGRYRCDEHGHVRPGRRRAVDLDAGRFEPPCPTCGRELAPEVVPEDAPADPRNVYAATKLHQEHLCAAVGAEIGVPVTALRYHNVYGPRMPSDTPYAGVASIFRSAIAEGSAPRVFEDGGQRRDFVHVTDVAHANVLALTAPEPSTGAFNICSGQPRTVGDLARTLSHTLGGPPPIVTGEWRTGDVRHVVASPDAARTTLGFRAGVSFEEGIAALYVDAPVSTGHPR